MLIDIVRENLSLIIRSLTYNDAAAALAVYRQCEDFLALGPVPAASLQMVRYDMELSERTGGIFCGIYTAEGKMMGLVDYIPHNYEGDGQTAFFSLLMIAQPFRGKGIGKTVVKTIENEIRKNPQVKTIRSGVQVNNPQAINFWLKNGYRIVSGAELQPDQTTAFALRKDFE